MNQGVERELHDLLLRNTQLSIALAIQALDSRDIAGAEHILREINLEIEQALERSHPSR
jgi:hypothetical protein